MTKGQAPQSGKRRKRKERGPLAPELVSEKGNIRVGESTVKGAGLGLFCHHTGGMMRGDWITEVDGVIISLDEARARRKDDTNRASHIRGVAAGQCGFAIDATGINPLDRGGGCFANSQDCVDTTLNSARFETLRWSPGHNPPKRLKHWDLAPRTLHKTYGVDLEPPIERCFLRSTRDILEGDEIFVHYGNNYRWD